MLFCGTSRCGPVRPLKWCDVLKDQMFYSGPSIVQFRGGFPCCVTHCRFSYLLIYMQFTLETVGQLAEYHLNYPFARWRYIFEAEDINVNNCGLYTS